MAHPSGMMSRSLLAGLFIPFVIALAQTPPAPWSFPDSRDLRTLHVSVSSQAPHPDGSAEHPYPSLKEALPVLQEWRKTSGVRLRLAPGTYRENFFLEGGNGAFPLHIDGTGAIISGSDLFTDWSREGDAWVAPWPHKFGFTANPYGSFVKGKTPGFRSEILFVSGRPMDQVLSRDVLVPGTYWIDEGEAKVWLKTQEGADPRQSRVEITVRGAANQPAIFILRNTSRVKVSGLSVTHCANPLRAAANIHGCSEIVVEDCRFDQNNGQGFQVGTLGALFKEGSRFPSNIVVRRITCNSNGVVGFGGSFSNSVWEDVAAIGNNWRGLRWGITGWFTCGFKFLVIGRVHLKNFEIHGNHAHGAWFDTAIEDTLVENLNCFGNRRMGLVVEGTRGPLDFIGGASAGNGEGGLQGFDSSGVSLKDMALIGNDRTQILMAGSLPFTDKELEEAAGKDAFRHDRLSRAQIPHHWRFSGNVIGSLQPGSKTLFDGYVRQDKAPKTGIWSPFFDSLGGEENAFFHPDGPDAPVAISDDLSPITFQDFKVKAAKIGPITWSRERVLSAWAAVSNRVAGFRVQSAADTQALGL